MDESLYPTVTAQHVRTGLAALRRILIGAGIVALDIPLSAAIGRVPLRLDVAHDAVGWALILVGTMRLGRLKVNPAWSDEYGSGLRFVKFIATVSVVAALATTAAVSWPSIVGQALVILGMAQLGCGLVLLVSMQQLARRAGLARAARRWWAAAATYVPAYLAPAGFYLLGLLLNLQWGEGMDRSSVWIRCLLGAAGMGASIVAAVLAARATAGELPSARASCK